MKAKWMLAAGSAIGALAACTVIEDGFGPDGPAETEITSSSGESETDVSVAETEVEVSLDAGETESAEVSGTQDRLIEILEAQPEAVQARYDARHPAETLQFFGIEPGMTVVEGLPGGGWYTKILMPYLGEEGVLIGAHYPDEIWPKLLPGLSEEGLARRVSDTASWPARARDWAGESGPDVGSYQMMSAPAEMFGTVDAVLFIRALHNLNSLQAEDFYLSATLAETYDLLKPGGIVGVVQHRAPETSPDDWADGSSGYLKQSYVIEAFEYSGFQFVASSEMNANPKDTRGEGDFVWRLPPTLSGTEEGTPEREAMMAIGESDRMTLLFQKPG